MLDTIRVARKAKKAVENFDPRMDNPEAADDYVFSLIVRELNLNMNRDEFTDRIVRMRRELSEAAHAVSKISGRIAAIERSLQGLETGNWS